MAEHEPARLYAALGVKITALPTLRRFDGLWRRSTAARPGSWLLAPGSWLAYAAGRLPGAVPAPADVVSTHLQPCLDPDLTGPPEGARYAVRSGEDEIVYLPMFLDALQEAGAGPLHAWINGAWSPRRRWIGLIE